MRTRVVLAAGALAAMVPALAGAQQRPPAQPRPTTPPATQPRPAQRPAMQPAVAPAAHREGSFELALSGGVFRTDGALRCPILCRAANLGVDPGMFSPGGAARLGYNFNQNWELSAGAGLGFGKNSTTLLTPFAALTYNFDINETFRPFIEVGGDMPRYSVSGQHVTASWGAFGGLGVRYFFSPTMALRVEGRMAYDKFKESSDPAYNSTGLVGLAFFIGGGPPKDTDADGVPDRKDKCAATPRGARVFPVGNARAGCPMDTDNDGVPDGLDQCANTPPTARPVYPIGNPRAGCPVDTDNDGVADYLDRCPNTPANARPLDANGCPVDSDHDGVADYLDRCANTAANTPVDANGCPLDADNDGVADNLDRCPNTPANARPVDANGCPVDSDHDGVADYLDRCANTPAGTQVDATGCPVAHELPQAGASLVLRNITFRSGTSVLLPASRTELDNIATALKGIPDSRWEINGYTDNVGGAATNLRLSRARAQSVMRYLVTKGVAASSMTAVGHGVANPVAPNTTAAGRAQNRRVEIKRLQ